MAGDTDEPEPWRRARGLSIYYLYPIYFYGYFVIFTVLAIPAFATSDDISLILVFVGILTFIFLLVTVMAYPWWATVLLISSLTRGAVWRECNIEGTQLVMRLENHLAMSSVPFKNARTMDDPEGIGRRIHEIETMFSKMAYQRLYARIDVLDMGPLGLRVVVVDNRDGGPTASTRVYVVPTRGPADDPRPRALRSDVERLIEGPARSEG